ncbi:GNAT family N-acetyltransferase [Cytobacillus suaedae]|nr:GNAT family N-acetyltransferase [Cytobacillus suaedae]
MIIRLASLADWKSVKDILDKTTLDLHKKGINQWDYPWDSIKIKNDIESSIVYIIVVKDKAIGTFCIKVIDTLSDFPIHPRSRYLCQIAILPEYQGQGIGSSIAGFACSYADEKNMTMYLDCWAGNQKLKSFYFNHGFSYLGDYTEEDYFISIFKYN